MEAPLSLLHGTHTSITSTALCSLLGGQTLKIMPKFGGQKLCPNMGAKKPAQIDLLLWPFRAHTMPGLVTATSLEDVTCMSKMFHTLRLARI